MERNSTTQEVLLEALTQHLTSLDELLNRCLPTLSARIWATCGWAESMSDGWKVGDYNFLILSLPPENDVQISIWSELHEPVRVEVSSADWSADALLKELGFEMRTRAENLRKEIDISSSAQAETVAREVLYILYEAFGYRGQWPLEIKCHHGERAEMAPTYTSVTPQDLAKLARQAGFEAVVTSDELEDVRFVVLGWDRWTSVAILDGRVPGHDLYSLITLQRTLSPQVTDEAIQELNATLRFLRVHRGNGKVLAQMPISLSGGVTAQWLILAFRQWIEASRRSELTFDARWRDAWRKMSEGTIDRIH